MLDTHLEQIELCASTISELPFPKPKIFTNAMLNAPDITTLIRDTEAHEQALFTLGPQPERSSKRNESTAGRRTTTFNTLQDPIEQARPFAAPRHGTAVASVLGGDLNERIRREYRRDSENRGRDKQKSHDDVDVELLLQGAEKLCSVYPIPGARERISTLRSRNAKVMGSLQEYEDLVAEQAAQLGQLNRRSNLGFEDVDDEDTNPTDGPTSAGNEYALTEEDLRKEEDLCAELERKKQTLEERVSGMEKDLGGLMR